jgi:hypothetical protein
VANDEGLVKIGIFSQFFLDVPGLYAKLMRVSAERGAGEREGEGWAGARFARPRPSALWRADALARETKEDRHRATQYTGNFELFHLIPLNSTWFHSIPLPTHRGGMYAAAFLGKIRKCAEVRGPKPAVFSPAASHSSKGK